MASSGTFEFDAHGRRLFRPAVPAFPRLEDVNDLLEDASVPLREFDRLLLGWRQAGSVGRLFARLDAVHSSGAEGSTTTFTDLMEYETSLKIAPDTDDASVVSACAEAFELEAGAPGDLEGLILRIHRRLFERAKDNMIASSAGQFKNVANATRDPEFPGNFFGYTNPTSVPEVLGEWRRFTMASEPGKPELVRQVLSHWMFEHIHPVTDGNGRIGRLLVPIVMKMKGKTRSACTFFGEAVHENKERYIDSLKDARITGDMTPFTRQMLSFVMVTAGANIERMRRLEALEKEWKKLVKARADSVIHRMIPYAVTKPVFTVRDAQKDLKAGFASINNAAIALVRAGVLSIPEDARRDRLFHATGVLDIFDRFRADPAPAPP